MNEHQAATHEKDARHHDLEPAIVQAARDLLAEGGMAALSMRGVAERVGVSATALYHYFANKQDLVDRVVRWGFERFGTYLETAARRFPKGSIERVHALGEAYLKFALENEEYFRVIFSIQVRDPRAVEDLPGGGGYPLLRQSVVDAMEAGYLRAADPDLVSHFLWATVHGVVTLVLACRLQGCEACMGAEGTSPLELFRAFEPFVRDGLAVRLPGPRGAEEAA
jgi:AcrR family transcriptional regulator